MSKFHLPTRFKTWNELLRRIIYDLEKSGTEFNNDTEIRWTETSLEYGPMMTFNVLTPGITIKDVKALAFDELEAVMPSQRQFLDALHGPPSDYTGRAVIRPLMQYLFEREKYMPVER